MIFIEKRNLMSKIGDNDWEIGGDITFDPDNLGGIVDSYNMYEAYYYDPYDNSLPDIDVTQYSKAVSAQSIISSWEYVFRNLKEDKYIEVEDYIANIYKYFLYTLPFDENTYEYDPSLHLKYLAGRSTKNPWFKNDVKFTDIFTFEDINYAYFNCKAADIRQFFFPGLNPTPDGTDKTDTTKLYPAKDLVYVPHQRYSFYPIKHSVTIASIKNPRGEEVNLGDDATIAIVITAWDADFEKLDYVNFGALPNTPISEVYQNKINFTSNDFQYKLYDIEQDFMNTTYYLSVRIIQSDYTFDSSNKTTKSIITYNNGAYSSEISINSNGLYPLNLPYYIDSTYYANNTNHSLDLVLNLPVRMKEKYTSILPMSTLDALNGINHPYEVTNVRFYDTFGTFHSQGKFTSNKLHGEFHPTLNFSFVNTEKEPTDIKWAIFLIKANIALDKNGKPTYSSGVGNFDKFEGTIVGDKETGSDSGSDSGTGGEIKPGVERSLQRANIETNRPIEDLDRPIKEMPDADDIIIGGVIEGGDDDDLSAPVPPFPGDPIDPVPDPLPDPIYVGAYILAPIEITTSSVVFSDYKIEVPDEYTHKYNKIDFTFNSSIILNVTNKVDITGNFARGSNGIYGGTIGFPHDNISKRMNFTFNAPTYDTDDGGLPMNTISIPKCSNNLSSKLQNLVFNTFGLTVLYTSKNTIIDGTSGLSSVDMVDYHTRCVVNPKSWMYDVIFSRYSINDYLELDPLIEPAITYFVTTKKTT